MKKSTKYENSNFSAPIAAESSARDIGGDFIMFSALCFDGKEKETRQGRIVIFLSSANKNRNAYNKIYDCFDA